MTMTRRQREFLREVINLRARTESAVHYKAVAEAIGVSKWTAYDMLRRLEKSGLVTAEYERRPRRRLSGRSKVLYSPTEAARRLMEDRPAVEPAAAAKESAAFESDGSDVEEWPQLRSRLLTLLKQVPKSGLTPVREQLWKESRKADDERRGVAFCASTIAVLTAHALSVGRRGRGTLFELVRRAPVPDLGLSIFAGTAVGMLVRKAEARKWSRQLADDVARYQLHLARFTHEQKQILYDFLQEALLTVAFDRY